MPIPWLDAKGIPTSAITRRYFRDGAGKVDMNINGNSTPVEYKFHVPEGGEFLLLGMRVCIVDARIDPNKFGDIPRLEKGVLFELRDDQNEVKYDLTDGERIRRNVDFAMIDGGAYSRVEGSANALLISSWVASGDNEPIILPAGWSIVVTIQDDLHRLEFFRMLVKGRFVPA